MNEPEVQANERVDKFGTLASSICAVHCALCAFAPWLFLYLGVDFLRGQGAEWAFTLFAIAIAIGALLIGWRRNRSIPVASLLAIGIIGLLVSRGLEMGSDHQSEEETHSHEETSHTKHDDETTTQESSKNKIEDAEDKKDSHEDEHHDDWGEGGWDEHNGEEEWHEDWGEGDWHGDWSGWKE